MRFIYILTIVYKDRSGKESASIKAVYSNRITAEKRALEQAQYFMTTFAYEIVNLVSDPVTEQGRIYEKYTLKKQGKEDIIIKLSKIPVSNV